MLKYRCPSGNRFAEAVRQFIRTGSQLFVFNFMKSTISTLLFSEQEA